MEKKVLFAASSYSHLSHFHRPYMAAFRAMGWKVHAACGGTELALPEAERVFFVPFEKKMTSPANLRAQSKLRTLLREETYTLVTVHTSLAAFFLRRAAAGVRPRPPVVNMVHGYLFDDETPILKRTILLAAEILTAPQTDLLLTMNAWDHREALRRGLGRRIGTVPGLGVDFSRLDHTSHQEGRALRRKLGFSDGDFLLLYGAEFSARKNQAMLLRALPLLPERVKLLLPGDGALLEDCKRLAGTLGITQRVRFPGRVGNMAPWYRAANGVVSASRSEGLPFHIMEAMRAELPVVASAVKGHTDLLQDGATGLLYPYGDKEAFAANVRKLLKPDGSGAGLGEAARQASVPYELERVLPLVMEQYLSLAPLEERKAAHEISQRAASIHFQ